MKKRIKLFMVAGLFLVTALEARTDLGAGFWLEDNNVTVTCENNTSASSNIVNTLDNNKIYTKYTTKANAKADAANACTSGITDMQELFRDGATNPDIPIQEQITRTLIACK